jgi:1-acyl-sn-glycerol-3-phosphate acyltransferase
MQAGVPVVSIVIRNAGELMWRGSSLVRAGTVDVVVLPPVSTEDWTAKDLDRHIDEIRQGYTDTFPELAGPATAAVAKEVVRS